MDSDNLNTLLNEMWSGVVESFNINILFHKINLDIKVVEHGEILKYKVEFKQVSSFYFLENCGERRLNPIDPEIDEYIELTSIDFYRHGVGKIEISSSKEEWANQYFSSANFAIEFWDAMLFIEAKSIVINGEEFIVDYPI
ncbi:hypothetical protein CN326_22770 [Bacillus sp. AFS018417]|uniref:YxiG family protein n=1 Tax=Bacillus sp. AFS018417 TaxID=2033491 RepID=UPI000BF71749|nr:hypothetical protein [Bacillus sp. AFS018417]PEZ00311.1 hypothetical protein CN326_22770 [Bacillus sp. AFS018417]